MADEFVKGLGIVTGAGLAWMVLASWYRTESFESTNQLVGPVSIESGNLFNGLGVTLMNVFFWFALFGALTFWVLIPGWRQAKSAYENRQSS